MIIVEISGQLGNQMFQFALGKAIELQGNKVLYDVHYFDSHKNHYFGLERFPVTVPKANYNDVLAFQEDRHRIIDRLRRKVFGKHPHVFTEIGSVNYAFRPDVFQFKKGFISGYWQSEKYFKPIEPYIRELYKFPSPSKRNILLSEEMQLNTSVSIHVRRGDYLGGFPVQDESYYTPAMDYFLSRYSNVRFYVFSNDLQWCHEHFKGDNIKFIDWNTGNDSLFDMWLMTQCQHNIIANSSFSWWGAWLNAHPNKVVVAPKLWFYHTETPDIYCPDWLVF